MCVWRGSQ
ncbi:hypothetical protein E2C01_073597 [Portunus trituberculatus]|uniref:Uncharacterized protein n=1 Tax=Portunus trituberculatus TaxID=210409 RepID=A0A5B7IA55_PORTR|nr:hypothetical protein [Portunus trituberculatus]